MCLIGENYLIITFVVIMSYVATISFQLMCYGVMITHRQPYIIHSVSSPIIHPLYKLTTEHFSYFADFTSPRK